MVASFFVQGLTPLNKWVVGVVLPWSNEGLCRPCYKTPLRQLVEPLKIASLGIGFGCPNDLHSLQWCRHRLKGLIGSDGFPCWAVLKTSVENSHDQSVCFSSLQKNTFLEQRPFWGSIPEPLRPDCRLQPLSSHLSEKQMKRKAHRLIGFLEASPESKCKLSPPMSCFLEVWNSTHLGGSIRKLGNILPESQGSCGAWHLARHLGMAQLSALGGLDPGLPGV